MGALQTVFAFLRNIPADQQPTGEPEADHRLTRSGLECLLRSMIRVPIALTITDNRRTMVSARARSHTVQLRLHHMFLSADRRTLRALGRYLEDNDPQASQELNRFIAQQRALIRQDRPRRVRVTSSGQHHDLAASFARLNAEYFDDALEARITWGRRSRRRRHSIKLGSYSARDALIRVHPALDRKWVPDFFVDFIVYHEMLHQAVPWHNSVGRRQPHGRVFRARERQFARFEEAVAWEQKNLGRLMDSRLTSSR